MNPPLEMEYRFVGLSGLELGSGAAFRFRWKLPGEECGEDPGTALTVSIGALGVISPPILADTGRSLEVVSGFRRLAAARANGLEEVPSFILDARDEGPSAALRVWLESSIHGEPLSEMEKITLTAKTLSIAGEHLPDFLPYLSGIFGRSITAALAGRLASLSELDSAARRAIHEGVISPGDLLQLGEHPGIDIEAAARLLAGSGLSRSARREAVRGLLRLADLGEDAFGEFAGNYRPDGMPLDEAVRSITHPEMRKDAEFILSVIKEMGLPPGTSIRLPGNLEGGSCTVEIRMRDEDVLRLSLDRLREALENGLIRKILGTLHGKS
jgi:hypothetical protein